MVNKCNITCEWMKKSRYVVNPDGQVLPCCYFANRISLLQKFPDPKRKGKGEFEVYNAETMAYDFRAKDEVVMNSYLDQLEDNNLDNRSLPEIMDGKWFNELYDSWDDSDRVPLVCMKYCQND